MLNQGFSIVRRYRLLFLLVICQSCSAQNHCSVDGWWQMEGRLTENYDAAASYSSNRLFFDGDSVYQASGFFYNTMGLDDDYPNGRYPFVYYGSKEKYKLEN